MVALTGPGDPLVTPDITLCIVREIHREYPGVTIGLKTLGFNGKELAAELADAGVEYVELLVDGVRSEIVEKLYAWIRPGHKTLKISEAAELLIKEQLNCVPALKFHDINVSILSTLYPGYNIDHLPKVSSEMMELGADSISLIPFIPETDAEVSLNSPTAAMIKESCERVQKNLPIITPLLARKVDDSSETDRFEEKILPRPTVKKPNVAVVSSNGIEIDLHLGQATTFLIYGPREDGLPCLLETRKASQPGSGKNRWSTVASTLDDCFALLTANAGETPRKQLSEAGISVLIEAENIEGTVDILYGGGKKCKQKK